MYIVHVSSSMISLLYGCLQYLTIASTSIIPHHCQYFYLTICYLVGLNVGLPLQSAACSLKCNADEECQLHYQITQDKMTIHTSQQSFVSLVAQPVERCVCLESTTCINPCSSNPCPRNKVRSVWWVERRI